jgi:DNA repair protein RadC
MNPKTQLSLFGQVSELKISYNPKTRPSNRPLVSSSRQAWDIFFKEWDEPAYFESFKVMTLNRANKVLGVALISRGGLAGTVADPKIILQYALLSNASSIILAHNHPSGNMTPSEADIKLTRKIKEACSALDIACLDHVILCSEEKYYSFADEGIM